MADNDLFSTTLNHGSFDNEGLDFLPLITKERTQKFELLLHLIPNLKQHLIVYGASGIGKTLLLDMLYDINSEAWQCCFVQGSEELSFETIEAQLVKTMLRNKHKSLDSAFHDFQEQHKKIVLIIDDAGLLVSGLITTLIDYATAQPALKLIFSLTPEARKNHIKTDRALENCYLLEIPALTKSQCAYFLRHLAAKPRTYNSLQILDEKRLDKIYQETQGIPAHLISCFTKLAREKQNDYSKWLIAFAGLAILAIAINQGIRHFKKEVEEPVNDLSLLPPEKIEKIEESPAPATEKNSPPSVTEPLIKDDTDIVPELKLDIEKTLASVPAPQNSPAATEATPVEKTPENSPAPVEPIAVAPAITPVQTTPAEPVANNEKIASPVKPEIVTPTVVEPAVSKPSPVIEPVAPVIAFPKVEPAKGMKIQPIPDKTAITSIPLAAPEVKKIEPKKIEIKAVEKIEVKPVEKPVETPKTKSVEEPAKKSEPLKSEPVKKTPALDKISVPKAVKEKIAPKEKIEPKVNLSPSNGHYTLQLITLSSDAAMESFQKKHPALNKDFRVVKSSNNGQERFSLMYGNFANTEAALQGRKALPSEFADALPRKLKTTP